MNIWNWSRRILLYQLYKVGKFEQNQLHTTMAQSNQKIQTDVSQACSDVHKYINVIYILYFKQYPDFTWERQTQGVILGAFFYGYIFTQIPGGYLATKFGGKRIFLIGIAATSVLTLLTPFLTRCGIGFLISTRVLEGLFEVNFKHNSCTSC